MVTFGIEEEYAFLDPTTLHPRNESPAVYRALHVGRAESRNVQREFLMSQLERPTPVCKSAEELLADLHGFRRRLSDAAESVGVLAASSGTFPYPEDVPTIVAKDRYRRVLDEFQLVGREYFLNGLHIHVGIPNREAGIRALNRLRNWTPFLVALGANSPMWNGADTGFASWRSIHMQRWTMFGTPPEFADAADYDRRLNRILGVGATFDEGLVAWNLRLSKNHPTIEVRAADVQLEAWHSVMNAVVVRALVTSAMEATDAPPALEPELIAAGIWHSARFGMSRDLLHPVTGDLVPAREVFDLVFEHGAAALEANGDTERLRGWADRLFEEGTGAERQRRAFQAGGLPALAALYRSALASEDD